ncbi:MAG: hypothetical protein HC789_07250 [Microcoleus sp. CSU_2_2]|nr:hypothetical protein [Microcoleus sp. SU_5_3]NJS10185.1 hypothetical protein [Microcoleus sp. CSU_2_2]
MTSFKSPAHPEDEAFGHQSYQLLLQIAEILVATHPTTSRYQLLLQ